MSLTDFPSLSLCVLPVGDHATFEEKIVKPVTKSFIEKKKIQQYQRQKELEDRTRCTEKEKERTVQQQQQTNQSDINGTIDINSASKQSKDEIAQELTGEDDGIMESACKARRPTSTSTSTSITELHRSTDLKFDATTNNSNKFSRDDDYGDDDEKGISNRNKNNSNMSSYASSGTTISHSRFLNAVEISAEGLSVLRKLHEQVSKCVKISWR